MTTDKPGWELFARYAFPPNELGYCGPPDSSVLLRRGGHTEIAELAAGFEGAWPYLEEIATAIGARSPLDTEVVRSYWIGGPQVAAVDRARLWSRLGTVFANQPTGVLDTVGGKAVAHHSFHVFVVYPWVRFLHLDPSTPLRILQSCRIRWGTVESVDDEQVVMVSRPLRFDDGALRLGEDTTESACWSRDGTSLAPAPRRGDTVAAHWDWICDRLDADEVAFLEQATVATLDIVNAAFPAAAAATRDPCGVGCQSPGP
ncbi:DUF6390 family protein [Candidatus Mycolicibacterium alkanivorans]|uniref:DUF6390 family protein n=1 Tax=Candidatus Mycolicibacterium alkanivorans TaxID=2954114 RepID=A0ABS9Z136_9MYCO|nr:DUF6390 family protein [Candidatus Mycolicibacterium alkanivorans]MCI4676683.1 DUF6390 family protein [Candidatus Mycolicibacterium alkanivorans]